MNRDDANVMTREDVLRELELLPMWKLRAPVDTVLTQNVSVEKLTTAQVAIADPEQPVDETPSGAAAIQYEITLSQDKQWGFVCELGKVADRMAIGSDIGALQSILFNNILYALFIEKPSKVQAESIADIQVKISDIKIIVAMGERMAQALLNTQEPLENLRSKLHPMDSAQLVATFDLAYLLNNPLDKAKVWQDLCLVHSYLQNLH